jgi:hypothetical protein
MDFEIMPALALLPVLFVLEVTLKVWLDEG